MRRYFGLLAVAVLVIGVLALASCSGSGSRRIIAIPTPGDYYLPIVGAADCGTFALGYNEDTEDWAYFDSADDVGAFEDVSGGGFAIPGGSYVTAAPEFFDEDGDGYADFFYAGIRGLTTEAANNDLYSGGFISNPGKIGGAAYIPAGLTFDPYIVLFIPISQDLANGTSVAVFYYTTSSYVAGDQISGYWSFVGYGSVDDSPAYEGQKVVVFNWSGGLGQFCAVVSVHSSGYGGT
ncbi:MAG: hypothetical protein A2Y63_02250 [Candidatus Riflebacteria bacterium RBG_13_59_9]|nr:MAG: hypothetical protein A2Y63_02250 [Candidatus Riflebacteria bacterium RBG_13_59_9]